MSALSCTQSVRELKRMAKEAGIDARGYEKTDLVQAIKRARMEKKGVTHGMSTSTV